MEEETGFFILRGPAPSMFALMEEGEEYQRLQQKGSLLLEHLRTDMLQVGDGIQVAMERFTKVRTELGI